MIPGQFLPDAGWPEPNGYAEVKSGTERIGTMNADVIHYVDAWTAPQVRAIVEKSKPRPTSPSTDGLLEWYRKHMNNALTDAYQGSSPADDGEIAVDIFVADLVARLNIDHDMVERACRAHWPSFYRMRPDHAAEKRVKMQAALAAALYGGRLRP